ncbi:MAG: porin family protein [Cyclobacteriaceae bacterium]
MKKLLLLAFFSVAITQLYAQNCAQRLSQAERDYEAGKLIDIPRVVLELLKGENGDYNCELSKEEEIRARKLLTKTYIFTDREAQAENALIGLLKVDPEHPLDKQVDPRELFFLMDQFRTEPIFRVAFRAGTNINQVYVIGDQFSTASSGGSQNFPKFYNGKTVNGNDDFELEDGGSFSAQSGIAFGFTGELMMERHLLKGVEVGLGVQFRKSSYNVDAYLIPDASFVTTVTNTQTYLRTPFLLRYNLFYNNHRHKLKPYVYGGASLDFLLSANYSEASRSGGTTFTLGSENADLTKKNQVNTLDYSIFGGAGVKLRINTHYLTLEGRYDNALNNYIDSNNRMASNSSNFDLAFVEDNLSLNNISITVGWAHSIYSPKKLKEFK